MHSITEYLFTEMAKYCVIFPPQPVLHRSSASVTQILSQCYTDPQPVLHRSSASVTQILSQCYTDPQPVLHRSSASVTQIPSQCYTDNVENHWLLGCSVLTIRHCALGERLAKKYSSSLQACTK